ncbi:MAG: glycosyltransferase family 1 protein, partial [Bacteroidota bacterium]
VHALVPMPIRTRKPLVVTVHDLTPLVTPDAFHFHVRFTFRRILSLLVQSGASFITNSAYTKSDLISRFSVDPARVWTTPLGVDDSFQPVRDRERMRAVKERYGLPERYFLFTGSMNRRKNLRSLLLAFKRYRALGGRTELVLVGRMAWGGSELERLVQDSGVDNAVKLPGYIAEEDLPAVISAARAMCYPSLYEGFGLPPLEAMACGVPVVASDASSIPEVTGGVAMLHAPTDVDELSRLLMRVDSDKQLREDLAKRGRSHASGYRWEHTINSTEEVYRAVAGRVV